MIANMYHLAKQKNTWGQKGVSQNEWKYAVTQTWKLLLNYSGVIVWLKAIGLQSM